MRIFLTKVCFCKKNQGHLKKSHEFVYYAFLISFVLPHKIFIVFARIELVTAS